MLAATARMPPHAEAINDGDPCLTYAELDFLCTVTEFLGRDHPAMPADATGGRVVPTPICQSGSRSSPWADIGVRASSSGRRSVSAAIPSHHASSGMALRPAETISRTFHFPTSAQGSRRLARPAATGIANVPPQHRRMESGGRLDHGEA
jgi:hypothetical protein